jgi:hypothetical protein
MADILAEISDRLIRNDAERRSLQRFARRSAADYITPLPLVPAG